MVCAVKQKLYIWLTIKGTELLDGEEIEAEVNDEHDEEEEDEVVIIRIIDGEEVAEDVPMEDDEGSIGAATEEDAATDSGQETTRNDIDALARVQQVIATEKARTSATLASYFAKIENTLGEAREGVRKRAAADTKLIEDLASEAKKSRNS